ncbi:MAG: phasin family protein [Methylobacteriaceae bacterium]|nr:phasin family protein [Methylobacteriaceae bacterium]
MAKPPKKVTARSRITKPIARLPGAGETVLPVSENPWRSGAPLSEAEPDIGAPAIAVELPKERPAEAAIARSVEAVHRTGAAVPAAAIEPAADGALPLESAASPEPVAPRVDIEPAAASEPAGNPLASSYAAAIKGIAEINAKAVAVFRTNSVATLQLVEALMGVRTIAEAVRLQTEHARKQFETLGGQAKELSALAQKVANDAAHPLQASFSESGRGAAGRRGRRLAGRF